VGVILSLAAIAAYAPLAPGQANVSSATTESTTAGPLQVHVTAVQGGAQYRPGSDGKWETVTAGLDLIEGVEFRTGPKGAIQFTVGTDQVYRVDRLTVVKVLRASLLPDGTIKTDVGMTYGRVSKDVDVASRPHQDTIVSPSSTLAVRGTRVSLYDQPPYAPEAVSLTGAAIFRNLRGELVSFGAKGGGVAKVNGDSTNAAQFQLQSIPVDPEGAFAGRTTAEKNLLASLSGLSGTQLGVFQNVQELIAGQTFVSRFTSVVGSLPAVGEVEFPMIWFSNVNGSEVNLVVTSPLGGSDFVSPTHQLSSPSGGFFVNTGGDSNIATGTFGQEEADFGNINGGKYPTGNYTITETLVGTATQSLAQNPTVTAHVELFPESISRKGVITSGNTLQTTLSVTDPSVTYTVPVPITPSQGGTAPTARKR
jgi:hypothetical protein